MDTRYQVDVLELKEIHELPNAWNSEQLRNLLHHIDYDGVDEIPEEELKEMTAMALSDLDLDDASVAVLEFRLGDRLNKGQRQNVSEDLKGERLWEEYSQIQDHEELFNVACMLYWAFPKKFSEPDIVRIKLKVSSLNGASKRNLQDLSPAFIARLLTDGMDEHNIIYRLFDDQIASDKFPEAEHIIWSFEETGFDAAENSNTITIHTSWNWVDELKGIKNYESKAHSDGGLK